MTILPTHSCFDDAAIFFVVAAIERRKPLLVHGIGLLATGEPFSHAWVEIGDEAFFSGILNGERKIIVQDRTAYYSGIQLRELVRYNVEEVVTLNKRFGHVGPWEERFRKLCKDIREAKPADPGPERGKAGMKIKSAQELDSMPSKHKRGDVFQINRTHTRIAWVGCLVLAEDITGWGIQGFIAVPDQGDQQRLICVRLEWKHLDYVGHAPLERGMREYGDE